LCVCAAGAAGAPPTRSSPPAHTLPLHPPICDRPPTRNSWRFIRTTPQNLDSQFKLYFQSSISQQINKLEIVQAHIRLQLMSYEMDHLDKDMVVEYNYDPDEDNRGFGAEPNDDVKIKTLKIWCGGLRCKERDVRRTRCRGKIEEAFLFIPEKKSLTLQQCGKNFLQKCHYPWVRNMKKARFLHTKNLEPSFKNSLTLG
jgi:hypothetical protein